MIGKTQILVGDCRALLAEMPSESVHCVVTSPPYWSLRDYGTDPLIWGGRRDCPHEWTGAGGKPAHPDRSTGGKDPNGSGMFVGARGEQESKIERGSAINFGDRCACGAWRGHLGLEPTPELYVQHMTEIFREVRRVLRSDGTAWVNLGDSYAGSWGAQGRNGSQAKIHPGREDQISAHPKKLSNIPTGSVLKPKDMVGIPWRVAFALQADGWYIRSDIIWQKRNPMPESIKDRPTKAHEYIFLLAKSEDYFYDAQAVKEPVSLSTISRCRQDIASQTGSARANGGAKTNGNMKAIATGSLRNRRSVWTLATQSFREAHFATYPEKLVEPCIQAGTSEHGCCNRCAAPYERVIEKGEPNREWQALCGGDANGEYLRMATKDFGAAKAQDASAVKASILAGMREKKTVGWKPTCDCHTKPDLFSGGQSPVPCTVLDPFGGSGTTALVANRLGRRAIIIELKPEYAAMAERRIASES